MDRDYKLGVIYGLAAYLMWGVLPIYWKLLHEVPALEILASRFIWSAVFVGLLLCVTGKLKMFVDETKGVFSTWKTGLTMLPNNVGMAAGLTIGFSVGLGGLGVTILGVLADNFGLPFVIQLLTWLSIGSALVTLKIPIPESMRKKF